MAKETTLQLIVDNSLYEHYREHLQGQDSHLTPEHEIARLVQIILNDSEYPLKAKLNDRGQIRISYHLRSFSQPLFWS